MRLSTRETCLPLRCLPLRCLLLWRCGVAIAGLIKLPFGRAFSFCRRTSAGPTPCPSEAARRRDAQRLPVLLVAVVCLSGVRQGFPAELAECRTLLLTGKNVACIHATAEAISKNRYGETWPILKAQAELNVGQFRAGLLTVEQGVKRYSWSIRLRWLGREIALREGNTELAGQRLAEILALQKKYPWRYTDAAELVVLGKIDQLNRRDVREILEERYQKARDRSRSSREPWLAIGGLALDTNDSQFAAEVFFEALKMHPQDPDLHFGLSMALRGSDPEAAGAALDAALQINPNHIPALLFQVDRLIDSEQYSQAENLIVKTLGINPYLPNAWAYRAVIAHLNNDPRGEVAFRDEALARWSGNPEVDYLIGKKLSQHYRFREGSRYQRRALAIDRLYVAAQRQLANDLLRLGDEERGWQLAEIAHESDSYNVETFNLLELRDEIRKFATLEDEFFRVRMDAVEAQLYGIEVLKLLNQARATLTEKYGLTLKGKVTVEIFPDENDFAVRTFGMPAVSGFLGVCFGRVITANSPASRRENPSNWQAVLWHEFCHVVTLELTGNRIPRWLSEGISVYEERQANSTWGQQMTPRYREFILAGEHGKLSELSSAFMNPPSGFHLQFAYYESALAVEFLTASFGQPAIQGVLGDLAAGLPINVALDRRCDSLLKIEADFDAFLRQRAASFAPQADWGKPEADVLRSPAELAMFLQENPNSFYALVAHSQQLIRQGAHAEAIVPLQKLRMIYPQFTAAGNPYEQLATVYRELERPVEEQAVLEEFAEVSADAVAANLRLAEIQAAAGEWAKLGLTAGRLLAVDPLLKQAHHAAALAAEKQNQLDEAIAALMRLTVLEPDDPADVHFRLASALYARGRNGEARRQVLMALEEAPRYRAAHRLLLKIVGTDEAEGQRTADPDAIGPETENGKSG
ncbi:MAG: tetratricopeptide repeat protein [Planctomycetaceae bacterium]